MKILHQPRPHRIVQTISDHLQQYLIVSNGMIMVLTLLQRPLPVQPFVDTPGGKSFKSLHHLSQGSQDQTDHDMHMVGHDN